MKLESGIYSDDLLIAASQVHHSSPARMHSYVLRSCIHVPFEPSRLLVPFVSSLSTFALRSPWINSLPGPQRTTCGPSVFVVDASTNSRVGSAFPSSIITCSKCQLMKSSLHVASVFSHSSTPSFIPFLSPQHHCSRPASLVRDASIIHHLAKPAVHCLVPAAVTSSRPLASRRAPAVENNDTQYYRAGFCVYSYRPTVLGSFSFLLSVVVRPILDSCLYHPTFLFFFHLSCSIVLSFPLRTAVIVAIILLFSSFLASGHVSRDVTVQ